MEGARCSGRCQPSRVGGEEGIDRQVGSTLGLDPSAGDVGVRGMVLNSRLGRQERPVCGSGIRRSGTCGVNHGGSHR
jgi:hypothetical protein